MQVCANLATTKSELFADMPVPFLIPSPFTDPNILFEAVEDASKFLTKVSPLAPSAVRHTGTGSEIKDFDNFGNRQIFGELTL